MNITDIRIRRLLTEGRLRAVVSITLDNELAVHDIKVIEGPERLFVAMPSRREENGTFRDVVHPISPEARNMMESSILEAYKRELEIRAAELELNPEPISVTENGIEGSEE
ncbi:MAG: septation regulator SpoVG [Clostridiales bacterium]|jgi:putative septation protein spoVG|nr:septation regulator SpoVG [Clostridiales bacterium]